MKRSFALKIKMMILATILGGVIASGANASEMALGVLPGHVLDGLTSKRVFPSVLPRYFLEKIQKRVQSSETKGKPLPSVASSAKKMSWDFFDFRIFA